MATFRDTDWDETCSKEMLTYLDWFCRNTTDKIFRRMDQLKIDSTGALRNSIRSTVYNNAAGNGALVRFYYFAYGRFIEMALGHNRGSDRDLVSIDKHGDRKVEGIKVRNRTVPEMQSWDTNAIDVSFHGTTDMGAKVSKTGVGSHGKVDRRLYHKARPFLMSSINAEMRRISIRLAERLAYFGSIQLSQAVVGVFKEDLKDGVDYSMIAENMEKPWLFDNGWDVEHTYNVKAYINGTLSKGKTNGN